MLEGMRLKLRNWGALYNAAYDLDCWATKEHHDRYILLGAHVDARYHFHTISFYEQ